MNKVFVYGTLRPSTKGKEVGETVLVPGYLYDLGWYPGIDLRSSLETDSRVVCEVIEVDDEGLRSLDRYEGYSPSNPKTSLYIRESYEDGFIYVWNSSFEGYDLIEDGDWLPHINNKRELA